MTRLASAVYRLLLRLLPASFRREYGEESLALFRRTVEEAGRAGGWLEGWRAAVAGWVGVVRGAVEERRDARGRNGRRGGMGRMLMYAVRQAVRSLTRRPGFTAGVVALMGLGIGATVTVLSVVDGVLVRALPYPEPDRLALIDEGAHSWPDFVDWTETVSSFQALAAATGQTFTLVDDTPREIEGARISERFFEIMGATALQGRLPTDEELREGRPVTVLGHEAWVRRWGGDEAMVGRTVAVDGRSLEVVGVLSPDFVPPRALTGSHVEIWVPVETSDPDLTRHDRSFTVVGRLAPGATLERAREELAARAQVFAREFPDTYAEDDGSPRRTFPPISLSDATVGEARGPLLVLLAGAALLLLVACGNVASLLLARGAAHRGATAVRRAMGASAGTILVQLQAEALLLGLMGAVVGLGMAVLGVDFVRSFEPGDLPRVGEVAVNLRVGAAATALGILTAMIAGVVPALRGARVEPGVVLRRARSGTRGRMGGAGGRWLVAGEAALSSLLLVGSLAVVTGFAQLVRVDPGFEPRGSWIVDINVGRDLPEEERGPTVERIRARLAELPGVTGVGAALTVPYQVSGENRCCWLGELVQEERELDRVWVHPVTAGYFEALGFRFAAGGGFAADDRSRGVMPVVLNEMAADSLFPSGSALGQPLRFASLELRVAGVIRNVRHWGADQPVEPEFYLPYEPQGAWASGLAFAVRSSTPPTLVGIRTAVARVAPRAIVGQLRSMPTVMSDSMSRQRFYMMVLAIFAGGSLVLAAAGLAGTLLYDTRQRRHELGIRIALGAGTAGLVRRTVLQGLTTVAVGAAGGLVAYWPLRRHLAAVAPQVDPLDPLALAFFAVVLGATALAAAWIPARLVARTDPLEALR